ncbi:MAG TPA: hypothetical protein VGK73_16355 [Polyangiaceae bacterium]
MLTKLGLDRMAAELRRVPDRLRRVPDEVRRWPAELGRLPERVRAMKPADWVHLVSVLVVWAVALQWFRVWYQGNYDILWDGRLQPDDARTAIFPFHRYAAGHPLADDPIANEMLEYQPYAYRLLFRFTVPFVGLLAATKIVAALLFGIVVAGGVAMMTSRRAGLGAGLLFIFVFFHDSNVQDRIVGGLPRSFGFPLTGLWLAGAFAARPWVRRAAALLSALTYPTALAMVLGAEGIYALRGLGRVGVRTLFRRVRHYAYLVVACAALLAPAVLVGMSDGGPIHTLEQAEKEPAFGRAGRLRVLPFPNAGEEFGKAFLQTYTRRGPSPSSQLATLVEEHSTEVAIALAALLIALPLLGLSPVPLPTAAFLAGSLFLYAMSRAYAFKLYSPERYYSIGMRVFALGLLAGGLGLVAHRLAPRLRRPLRNFSAAGVILLMWFTLGNGVGDPPMSYDIDYRRDAALWNWAKTTPIQSRFACHLSDCDSMPLFGERANTGGFETMQPWLTRSWARQKARTEETFRAIYATDKRVVFDYAKKYKVSHFIINKGRYNEDFVARSRSFEPLTSYTRDLLGNTSHEDLLFGDVPPEAVVFRHRGYLIVSVEKLAKVWGRR